jgi:hypothetical protein
MKRDFTSRSLPLRSKPIKPPYKFQRGEGGIFVEIYLPKKAEFQGTLYNTLVKGFRVKNIKNHFKDSEKVPGIKKLLKDFKDSVRFLDTREEIDAFPSVLKGYSMFEVEGVFYNSKKRQIQAELTQVISIMFKPDLQKFSQKHKRTKDAAKRINRVTKDYLRFPDGREEFVKARRRRLGAIEQEVLEHLAKWTNYVGLFLFGYLVYEICEQITKLVGEGAMKWDDAEDEIWVTSFWNLVINPIKLVKPRQSRK